MVDNLTESLKHTPWLLWASVAAVALVGESIERGGWLGRIGLALLAGGVVAAIWPGLWWLQLAVAVAAGAVATVVTARRT